MKKSYSVLLIFLICSIAHGQKPRARDLGIPLEGKTGTLNAITDVDGTDYIKIQEEHHKKKYFEKSICNY